MKFVRLRIGHFGPLKEIDSGPGELPGLTVVRGHNEAGKSSFFLALRALVHGIYPASRDGNPHTPWDGADMEVEARIRTRSGEEYRVHRRLLSSAWGRLYQGEEGEGEGRSEDIGNRSIPSATHVSRQIYEHVYAITLPQMAQLQEGDVWKELRDRLVVGMGGHDLGSPRRVAEALDEEAGSLWRPNRRGTPRAARIREELKELGSRRSGARDRDEELRGTVSRRFELERRRATLRDQRTERVALLDRVRTYAPLAGRLRAIEELRRSAEPTGPLEALPSDPQERLAELRGAAERARERRREAEEAEAEARSALPGPDPLLDALEEHRDSARSVVASRPVVEERRRDIDLNGRELKALEDELALASGALFGSRVGLDDLTPDTGLRSALVDLPVGELRSRIRKRDEAIARVRAARSRGLELGLEESAPAGAPDASDEGAPSEPHVGTHDRRDGPRGHEAGAPTRPRWAIPAVGGGGILVLLSLVLTLILGGGGGDGGSALFPTLPLILGATGVLGLLFGGLALREWGRRTRAWDEEEARRQREREVHEDRVIRLQAEADEARSRVDELLADLPLREERRVDPDEGTAGELEALRDRLERADRLRRRLQEIEGELARVQGRTHSLLSGFPDETSATEWAREDLPGTLAHLASALERLDDRIERRTRLRSALESAARERAGAESALEEATEALREFERRLEAAVPPTDQGEMGSEARARLATVRREALSEARHIERELIREHGTLDSVREGVSSLPRAEGETSIGELEERVQRLADDEGGLREEIAELRARESSLLEGETVDTVEATRRQLEEELGEVREERDRLWVLARLVRTAEREFRETHQPELIRRAEEYLARITGGRYTTLLLGDEGNPDALLLRAPHLPDALAVDEPISTGTREQVFLALRLAILDLIEGDGEPLPLILDEALVNWDRQRRGRALDLLKEVSGHRQIFLFTCHAPLAAEVEARGGARIDLPTPDAGAADPAGLDRPAGSGPPAASGGADELGRSGP